MEYKKEPSISREDLKGTWAMQRETEWPSKQREELAHQALIHGLESADSISDRSISLSDRGCSRYTALLASRVIINVLGTLVLHRKLGRIPPPQEGEYQQPMEQE